MLVATDKSKTSSARAGTAMPGQVVVSGRSRIILEPGEEVLGIYYLLDIINNSSAPVEPPVAFTFDMPPGSIRTGLLEGSTSAASVNGQQINHAAISWHSWGRSRGSCAAAATTVPGRATLVLPGGHTLNLTLDFTSTGTETT